MSYRSISRSALLVALCCLMGAAHSLRASGSVDAGELNATSPHGNPWLLATPYVVYDNTRWYAVSVTSSPYYGSVDVKRTAEHAHRTSAYSDFPNPYQLGIVSSMAVSQRDTEELTIFGIQYGVMYAATISHGQWSPHGWPSLGTVGNGFSSYAGITTGFTSQNDYWVAAAKKNNWRDVYVSRWNPTNGFSSWYYINFSPPFPNVKQTPFFVWDNSHWYAITTSMVSLPGEPDTRALNIYRHAGTEVVYKRWVCQSSASCPFGVPYYPGFLPHGVQVIYRGSSTIDLFAIWNDGSMRHAWIKAGIWGPLDSNGWQTWENLGGSFNGAKGFTASSSAPTHTHTIWKNVWVSATTMNGPQPRVLINYYWELSGWTGWQVL